MSEHEQTEEKPSKFDVSFKDGSLNMTGDFNQDGEPVVKVELHMDEVIQEVIKRGDAVEGEQIAKVKFNMGMLEVHLDTDKDGEPSGRIAIDLSEALDESGLLKG